MTQYYNNITSPIWRECENTKRHTSMNSIKGAHELQKEKLERRAGGLEG